MSQIGYGNNDCVGVPFDYAIPVTGFNIQMLTNKLIIDPAGTLATGTIVLPQNPPDGTELEIMSTQTQTAVTLTAGTGDVFKANVATPTALVANSVYCFSYTLNGFVNPSTGVKTNARTWYATGTRAAA